MQSLMSGHVDHTSQGKLQGAINSIRAITGMAGPPLFGYLFKFATAPKSSVHFPGAPYFLAGLLLFSSVLLTAYVTRTQAKGSSTQPAETAPNPEA